MDIQDTTNLNPLNYSQVIREYGFIKVDISV